VKHDALARRLNGRQYTVERIPKRRLVKRHLSALHGTEEHGERRYSIRRALPTWLPLVGTAQLGQAGTMMPELTTYPGYRFPAEIISHALWLYHVFGLSLRQGEIILAEHGIGVSHESIRQWCLKFGGDIARKLRRRPPKPGDVWHLDKV
jgi:putative transposase